MFKVTARTQTSSSFLRTGQPPTSSIHLHPSIGESFFRICKKAQQGNEFVGSWEFQPTVPRSSASAFAEGCSALASLQRLVGLWLHGHGGCWKLGFSTWDPRTLYNMLKKELKTSANKGLSYVLQFFVKVTLILRHKTRKRPSAGREQKCGSLVWVVSIALVVFLELRKHKITRFRTNHMRKHIKHS